MKKQPLQFGLRTLFVLTMAVAFFASALALNVILSVSLLIGLVTIIFGSLWWLAAPSDTTVKAHRANVIDANGLNDRDAPGSPYGRWTVGAAVLVCAIVNILAPWVDDVSEAFFLFLLCSLVWTVTAAICARLAFRGHHRPAAFGLCVLSSACVAIDISILAILSVAD